MTIEDAISSLRRNGLSAKPIKNHTQIMGGSKMMLDKEIEGFLNGFIIYPDEEYWIVRFADTELNAKYRLITHHLSLEEAVDIIVNVYKNYQ